jgi:hypothetical protein
MPGPLASPFTVETTFLRMCEGKAARLRRCPNLQRSEVEGKMKMFVLAIIKHNGAKLDDL